MNYAGLLDFYINLSNQGYRNRYDILKHGHQKILKCFFKDLQTLVYRGHSLLVISCLYIPWYVELQFKNLHMLHIPKVKTDSEKTDTMSY